MSNSTLQELFNKFLGEQMSPEELSQLQQLIRNEKNSDELDSLLQLAYSNKSLATTADYDTEQIFAELKMRTIKAAPVVRSMFLKKIAVAASILLVIGLGSYFIFFNKPSKQNEIVQAIPGDVNPGSYKARLTLADGRIITLDSAVAGELTQQGGTVVLNKNGQLVYDSKNRSGEVLYNTLSTAKGEGYSTVLADGSKVWLNSGSSIKFPVAFNGNERKVEISGEAYFEVAHNARQPFKVSIAGGASIEVLGTHFNVSAYNNENSIKTTLLEGSVKTSVVDGRSVIIKPGQQAEITTGNQLTINNNVDVEKITAWKNNDFLFSGDDIQFVMRMIERWYDVEVEYKGQITDRHFTGIISRNNKVSEVLKMLQATEKIQFEITGKKIIVSK